MRHEHLLLKEIREMAVPVYSETVLQVRKPRLAGELCMSAVVRHKSRAGEIIHFFSATVHICPLLSQKVSSTKHSTEVSLFA